MKKPSKAKVPTKPAAPKKKVEKAVPKVAPKVMSKPIVKEAERPVPKELKIPKEEYKAVAKPSVPVVDPAQERMTKMLDIISKLPGGKNFKK